MHATTFEISKENPYSLHQNKKNVKENIFNSNENNQQKIQTLQEREHQNGALFDIFEW